MNKASAARVAALWVHARRVWAGLHNLKPNDVVTVYHGTRVLHLPKLINGFDANRVTKRDYQPSGYRHSGLFVSPVFEEARRFGSTQLVLEIKVQAKNLHGTDYSGRIKRQRGPEWEWESERDRKQFPESFRPSLSSTLLQSVEPQAILRGLVKPSQIKRVWYQPSKSEQGRWYTRKEFLDLGVEVYEPHGRNKPIRDVGWDLSQPNYTLDQFMEAMAASYQAMGHGSIDKARVEKMLLRTLRLPPDRRDRKLMDTFDQAGFGPTAAEAFHRRLLELAPEPV